MKSQKKSYSTFLGIMGMYFILTELFIADAYAYIDPGSGSLIIQMLIGALVGVGITIKVYWFKIKEKFISKASKE